MMYLAEGPGEIRVTTAPRLASGVASSLTAALVVADDQVREELRKILSELSVHVVLEQPAAAEWSVFMGRLSRRTPDLLLIDAPQFQDPFVGAAREIKSLPSAPAVFAVVGQTDAEAALKAIRAGAVAGILPPLDSSLRDALQRVGHGRAVPERDRLQSGKAIGFLSAKGGCGATILACQVAAGLRQLTEHEVLLADFDFGVGALGGLMQAQTPYSSLDAIKRHSAPDFYGWGELVWKALSRLDVLPAPDKPFCEELPEAHRFRAALKSMQLEYGWVVMDLGRGLNFPLRALAEDLDRLFLVSTPDTPALYQAKRVVQSLASNGCSLRHLTCLLNRMSKHCPFTPKEIQDLLGVDTCWELAELPELEQAFSRGRLVGVESRSGRRLMTFVSRIAGLKPVEVPSRQSILGLTRLLPEVRGVALHD